MKQLLKDIATYIGIGLPYFFLLYSCIDVSEWNSSRPIILGIIFGICIELVKWGLKKEE